MAPIPEDSSPETLSAAMREHLDAGKSPCAFGIAMSKVPAKRWTTRADLYDCLDKAYRQIETGFREALSLAALSSQVGVSAFHFQRLYKETYGISPNGHQRRLRLQEARRLIAAGSSVTEACFEVGFQSPSSFTRYFRREFGLAPGDCRKPETAT